MYLADAAINLIYVVTPLILMFWIPEQIPLEMENLNKIIRCKYEMRASFGIISEKSTVEKLLLEEEIFVVSGCNLIFFRRRNILSVLDFDASGRKENCDDFIPPFESSSSNSSEFEENHQIHKVNGYNVNDYTNLISSIITTPKRLVSYSNTSDDESSDNLRPHTPIFENTVQFPADTHIESSVHNDRVTSTDQRDPKRKLFPLRENTSGKRIFI
ncbi:hypothetical protein AVEN_32790-1 [Araneus ventricosus]|uniref:Uncharacterized protein n=1 Tax=Araneus ventricosus TaxID=182803 RepID=A0A4Y2T719_ARAVE|nr:hypothetical protein AVEN_32790-1 [Araneus ventricosus]